MHGMMSGHKMCSVHMVCYWLVWIGAINWGLVGAFDVNLVTMILGGWPMVVKIVYILIGLSALAMLAKGMCKGCKMCKGGSCECCDDKGGAGKTQPSGMGGGAAGGAM